MNIAHLLQRRPLLASLVFVALVTTAAVEAPAATPAPETLRRQVDELLASRVPAAGPGVALLIARGDALLYRSARGMASLELGMPLAPEHVFRIGSVTKQFAAAALLKQVDAGQAQLSDPLSKFLPDFPGAAGITLTQLLNHTSGVKSYTGIRGYMDHLIRRDLSTAELSAVFRDLPVDFAPGSAWAYNNSGYVLVGAVTEVIGKRPWHEQVVAMLQPLQITRTTFGDNAVVVPGMADGYSSGADGRVQRAGMLSMTQPHAAGALLSTVDELWRWNLALHGGRVLSPESYRRMSTPEGGPAEGARYAFGLQTGSLRGQPLIHHGGGIHGYGSMLLWLPAQQMTVVVLRNSDGPGADTGSLARQAAALALGDPYPDGPTVALPEAELQALAGRWRAKDGQETVLSAADGKLAMRNPRGALRAMRHIGGGRFLFERGMSRLELLPGRSDSARFYLDGEGAGVVWQRVGDAPTPPPAARSSAPATAAP